MWWISPGFLAFDTETTGTSVEDDRIITAAVVRFMNGRPVQTDSWLIDVDVPIPEASTAVHGITDSLSRSEGRPQREALAEIREVLAESGLPLVAFNADFDVQILEANLARLDLAPLLHDHVICPMVLDKHFNKYVRGSNQRRLAPTAGRYGVDMDQSSWHGAEADAIITGEILLAQFNSYPELRAIPLAQLSVLVLEWRKQQEADFQAWLATRETRKS